MMNENENPQSEHYENKKEATFYDVLQNPNSVVVFAGIKTLIIDVLTDFNKGKIEQLKQVNAFRFKAQIVYCIFVALIIIAISILSYLELIEKTVTATLLSLVIGYTIGNSNKKAA